MGCQSEVVLENNLVFSVNTHDINADAGAADADSLPTYRVYEEETGTAILTGTMAKLDDANTLGFYTEQIACTAVNGFEAGKVYGIYIEATVDSIKGGIAYNFICQNAACGGVILENDYCFYVTTHDTTSDSALSDADSVPTYRVYEDETGTAILSGSMAKLDDANTLGFYSELIACTAANGFEVGKTYTVYISSTVNSVEGTISISFTCVAASIVAPTFAGINNVIRSTNGVLLPRWLTASGTWTGYRVYMRAGSSSIWSSTYLLFTAKSTDLNMVVVREADGTMLRTGIDYYIGVRAVNETVEDSNVVVIGPFQISSMGTLVQLPVEIFNA